MHSILWFVASSLLQQPVGPVVQPAFVTVAPDFAAGPLYTAPPPRPRPRAVEYSDFYTLRATIHRDASFATLPLFVAEYAIGRSLYNKPPGGASESLRSAHGAVAAGIAGLFVVGTVTGGWNLWDARKDAAGRTRRYVHSTLMLLATAGFVATGALAPDDDESPGSVDQNRRNQHRTVAIASMSTSLVGYLMMLIWKD